MKKRLLALITLSTVAINSLYATCAKNIDMQDNKVITSATEFADDELVPKSYVANMIETNLKQLPSYVTVENGDVNETYGIIIYNGRAWFDRNLGATKVAESWDDQDEAAWGELHQWGKNRGPYAKRNSPVSNYCVDFQNRNVVADSFHKATTNGSNWISSKNNSCKYSYNETAWWQTSNQWDDPANRTGDHNICPKGWHVASIDDFKSLNLENAEDGFNKIKLLGVGGMRDRNGNITDTSVGRYWTSTISGEIRYPMALVLSEDRAGFGIQQRVSGLSIRCVKNLY